MFQILNKNNKNDEGHYLQENYIKSLIHTQFSDAIQIWNFGRVQNLNHFSAQNQTLSRKHASILLRKGGFYLLDLFSKYGSGVNRNFMLFPQLPATQYFTVANVEVQLHYNIMWKKCFCGSDFDKIKVDPFLSQSKVLRNRARKKKVKIGNIRNAK